MKPTSRLEVRLAAAAIVAIAAVGVACPVAAQARAPKGVQFSVKVPSGGDATFAQLRLRLLTGVPRGSRVRLKVLNGRALGRTISVVGAAGTAKIGGHKDVVISIAVANRGAAGIARASSAKTVSISATATKHFGVKFERLFQVKDVRAHRRVRAAGALLPDPLASDLEAPTYIDEIESAVEGARAFLKGVDDLDDGIDSPEAEAAALFLTYGADCPYCAIAEAEWLVESADELRALAQYAQSFLPWTYARSAAQPPVDAIKVVVPATAAGAARTVTNFICPTQLPRGTIAANTLTCTGGTLHPGDRFSFNVRMTPNPTTGMGGQLFLRVSGVFKGPFPIKGP